MHDRDPPEKLAGLCWRASMASIILAFFMVLASFALRYLGVPEALGIVGSGIVLAAWLVWTRLRAYGLTLGEFLATRGRAGRHVPPMAHILAGALFWSAGLYFLLTATEPPDRKPHEMTVLEKRWFGATVVLMGAGISGLGLSEWLGRRSMLRQIARASERLRNRPNDAQLHVRRGHLLSEWGDFRRAVEDFSEAVRLDPELAEAYAERGGAYFGLQDFPEAIADFSAAIRLDPANPALYVDRSAAYSNNGQPAEAEADFDKAEELGLGEAGTDEGGGMKDEG